MATAQSQALEPVWFLDADMPRDLQPLRENTQADVCIVGAGIAGMTTAYLLAREGQKVVVLEASDLGDSETGRTTAHLSNALDDRYSNLERVFGREGARRAAGSHTAAIDRIETIARDEHLDCDFARVDGFLFVPPGESLTVLEQELAASHRAGLTDVERWPNAPLPFDTGPCLRFPRQGQFHPVKYLNGLVAAVRRRGVRIYTQTRVTAGEGGKRTAEARTSDGYRVTADALVVATNTPVNDWITMHTKQYPYRTYAVAFRIPKGVVNRALYWDTADPYHYIRTEPHNDTEEFLIVGGEDHKTGQVHNTGICFERLEHWTRERFPELRGVAAHWSGQVMEPMDYLAYIGRNPGDFSNVYIATGDSGHGMTHGTIAGMLLTDLIRGRQNPWARLYDPSRTTFQNAGTFLSENLNVAAQYLDWILPGDTRSVEELQPGEGMVVQRGLQKVALYRDDAGRLHQLSAVCPHLGCIVQWNKAEHSWDCPCHGSRFDGEGKVIHGPALGGLKQVK
jgi:glycine/D-amino acid oxidase-like deaminating enzyme/nitrite reductase/ring-hydroxylating ferredoxin subunit